MNQIKLTAELLAEGWSPAELDRRARTGELQRIRRGAYECAPARSLDRRDEHRRLGWRGMLQARRAMNFLDARSESAGESYSRVLLDRIGIPAPIPQYEVWHRGVLIGRADFGWEEFGTLGEFDGKQKYGRLLKPGQTAVDAVFEEKRREDALRDLGWQLVRWLWRDLYHPAELRERLEGAFERGLRAA